MPTINDYQIVDGLKKYRIMILDCLDACRHDAQGIDQDTGQLRERPEDMEESVSDIDFKKAVVLSHAQAGRNLAVKLLAYIDVLGVDRIKEAFDVTIPGNTESISSIRSETVAMKTYADGIISGATVAKDLVDLDNLTSYVNTNIPKFESPRRLWALLETKKDDKK